MDYMTQANALPQSLFNLFDQNAEAFAANPVAATTSGPGLLKAQAMIQAAHYLDKYATTKMWDDMATGKFAVMRVMSGMWAEDIRDREADYFSQYAPMLKQAITGDLGRSPTADLSEDLRDKLAVDNFDKILQDKVDGLNDASYRVGTPWYDWNSNKLTRGQAWAHTSNDLYGEIYNEFIIKAEELRQRGNDGDKGIRDAVKMALEIVIERRDAFISDTVYGGQSPKEWRRPALVPHHPAAILKKQGRITNRKTFDTWLATQTLASLFGLPETDDERMTIGQRVKLVHDGEDNNGTPVYTFMIKNDVRAGGDGMVTPHFMVDGQRYISAISLDDIYEKYNARRY
jgi:hypothetical protein